jgi:hypothetical protein
LNFIDNKITFVTELIFLLILCSHNYSHFIVKFRLQFCKIVITCFTYYIFLTWIFSLNCINCVIMSVAVGTKVLFGHHRHFMIFHSSLFSCLFFFLLSAEIGCSMRSLITTFTTCSDKNVQDGSQAKALQWIAQFVLCADGFLRPSRLNGMLLKTKASALKYLNLMRIYKSNTCLS